MRASRLRQSEAIHMVMGPPCVARRTAAARQQLHCPVAPLACHWPATGPAVCNAVVTMPARRTRAPCQH